MRRLRFVCQTLSGEVGTGGRDVGAGGGRARRGLGVGWGGWPGGGRVAVITEVRVLY